ncbi:hypothetical protein [Nocardia abscessus]|uniref:hypothetical protein n=1 Tax=Nocardia abscessus TaxID=120957 RepID=UPI002454ADC6|nr:hypothetical protein [Nocardia abscessus]
MIIYANVGRYYDGACRIIKLVGGDHPQAVHDAKQRLDHAHALPGEYAVDPREVAAELAVAPESEWAAILDRAKDNTARCVEARNALTNGALEQLLQKELDRTVGDHLDHYLTLIAPRLDEYENAIRTAAPHLRDLDPHAAVRTRSGGHLSELLHATKELGRLLCIYPATPRDIPQPCLWLQPPADAGAVRIVARVNHYNRASELGAEARNLAAALAKDPSRRIALEVFRGARDGYTLHVPRTKAEVEQRYTHWQRIHQTTYSNDLVTEAGSIRL